MCSWTLFRLYIWWSGLFWWIKSSLEELCCVLRESLCLLTLDSAAHSPAGVFHTQRSALESFSPEAGSVGTKTKSVKDWVKLHKYVFSDYVYVSISSSFSLWKGTLVKRKHTWHTHLSTYFRVLIIKITSFKRMHLSTNQMQCFHLHLNSNIVYIYISTLFVLYVNLLK